MFIDERVSLRAQALLDLASVGLLPERGSDPRSPAKDDRDLALPERSFTPRMTPTSRLGPVASTVKHWQHDHGLDAAVADRHEELMGLVPAGFFCN